MFSKLVSAFVPALLLASVAQAATPTTIERSIGNINKRSVGALTPLSSKTTVCDVLDYGAVADGTTDIAPAIESAFSSCVSNGGATLYIPPGNYSIATGVKLNKGSAWAFQIDGLITLTADGSFDGNAIVIENTSDVEIFSSNGLGAINGQGYLARKNSSGQNARLLRLISCSDVSIHDLLLIDSPTFHLVFNEVSNLEGYHLTVRGPNIGGTDGIDLICTDNCYLHHIEVTNRDECISVKSPSSNVLIEEVYCNHSGGMSIGSLTADDVTTSTEAQVSNITMRNIYVFECTQMLMIKTFPGGSGATGYVKDSTFENFWAYDTTYGLDIDQYWESHTTPDTGAVELSGLTFSNWTGTVDNGVSRGPVVIRGSDIVPITDITLKDFDMWTVNGDEVVHQCKNVYGTGYCAASSTGSSLTTFTTSMTVTATPTGYVAPTSPAWGITGYGTTDPIPVYTPAAFWSPVSSGVATTSVTAAAAIAKTSSAAAVSSVKTTSASQTASAAKTTFTASTSPVTEVANVEASSSVAISSSKTKCSSSVAASVKAAYSRSVAASFSSAAAISASTDAARVTPSMPIASGAIIASANSTSKCTKPATSLAAVYSSSVAASFSSAAAAPSGNSVVAVASTKSYFKPASSSSAAHASSVAASFSSVTAVTASSASSTKSKCTKPASSLAAAYASSVAASFSSAAAVTASSTSSAKSKCTKPASSLAAAYASSVAASFSSASAVPNISSSKNCTKPASSVMADYASSVSAGFASGFSTSRARKNNVVASGVAAPSGFLTSTKSSRARQTFARHV